MNSSRLKISVLCKHELHCFALLDKQLNHEQLIIHQQFLVTLEELLCCSLLSEFHARFDYILDQETMNVLTHDLHDVQRSLRE